MKEELVKESVENVWFLDSRTTDQISNNTISGLKVIVRSVRISDGIKLRAE